MNFEEKAKLAISRVVNINMEDLALVWMCKTLQNRKYIFTAPLIKNFGIVEVTFNGSNNEIYVDKYVKESNTKFNLSEL